MKTTISEITSICYCTRIIASKLNEIVTKLHKYSMKIFLPFRALSLPYALPGVMLLNCILPQTVFICIELF